MEGTVSMRVLTRMVVEMEREVWGSVSSREWHGLGYHIPQSFEGLYLFGLQQNDLEA
jgi:hypothetical protein